MITSIDYRKLVVEAIEKWDFLNQQRQEIDAEIFKLRQFLYATMNLLPDADRMVFQSQFANIAARFGSLVDATREVLKLATQRKTHFTAAEVKEHLVKAGFDFSQYSSNPLASVNTTIRRFKDSDVECREVNGVAAYRWIFRFPREATAVDAGQRKSIPPENANVLSGKRR